MFYLSSPSVRPGHFRSRFAHSLEHSLERSLENSLEHSLESQPYPPILKRGDRSPAVRTLRLLLASSQYLQTQSAAMLLGDRFTSEVEQWVRQFQSSLFLPVDGIAGPDTWRALCADAPVHLSQLEWGDRGSEVLLLQQHLAKYCRFFGPIDGVFSEQTEAAVRTFQQNRSLAVDGIVGARTWESFSLQASKHYSSEFPSASALTSTIAP